MDVLEEENELGRTVVFGNTGGLERKFVSLLPIERTGRYGGRGLQLYPKIFCTESMEEDTYFVWGLWRRVGGGGGSRGGARVNEERRVKER